MSRRTALIAGAGIGGLAAAIALRRSGWDVRLFERSSEPRALGFALSLAPNAIRALQELGLADDVATDAWPVGGVDLRGRDGTVLKRFDIQGALGQTTSLFILRERLHHALLAAAGRENVTFDWEVAKVDDSADRVSITARDERRAAGDLLIAADGVASAIVTQFHPGTCAHPSGYWAVRGLARGVIDRLNGRSIVAYIGGGLEAAAIRASADSIYWYISLRAASASALTGDVRDVVSRWLDAAFGEIVRATADAEVRVDELFERDPVTPWGRGRVTLLGDAAQPVLPHTGQGAALALEDAVALGLALRSGDIEPALRRYERVRAARKRPVIARGRRMAWITSTTNPLAAALRGIGMRYMPVSAAAAAFLEARTSDPHSALR